MRAKMSGGLVTFTRYNYSKWQRPGNWKPKTSVFEICLFRKQTLPLIKVRTILMASIIFSIFKLYSCFSGSGRSDMHFKLKEYENENLAAKNFISIISIFFVVLCQSIFLVPSPFSCVFEVKFVGNRIILTSDHVCCDIRNVKFIKSYAVQANFCNRCLQIQIFVMKCPKAVAGLY